MVSLSPWGLPNNNHPFPYFMDESHQLQAVRTVIKYGTSNYPQQENGPMFHYIVSAALVSPLVAFGAIDPFAIKSAISSNDIQRAIYIAFRMVILLFGVLSLLTMIRISKILKINSALVLLLVVLTPVWLSISNYFKYDIPFVFWTLLSFYLMLLYSQKNSSKIFLLAGATSALALATKITAVPLLVIYILSFFYFTKKPLKSIQTFFYGLVVYVITFIFLGIPDIIFGGRSMSEYLYYNIFLNPQNDKLFLFGVNRTQYLFGQLFPTIFGHFFFYFSVISVGYLVFKLINLFVNHKLRNEKVSVFLLLTILLFSVSFIPLWIIGANRALIILPFLVLSTGIFTKDIYSNLSRVGKIIFVLILIFGFTLQSFETYSWVVLKFYSPPQVVSSSWIYKNLPKNTLIGIENVPVYQMLPDIVVKEYYETQYNIKKKYNFKYKIIDEKSEKLPPVIILSNSQFEYKYKKTSPKKSLLLRMYKENYHEIASFSPNPNFYKLFTNDINFVMTGMQAVPLKISVFIKK